MNQNIHQILNIQTWTYQIKKYLTIGNTVFKYYYQSKKQTEKSLLLLDSKNPIIDELIFYFKNYSSWDVALLDKNSNIENIKFISNSFVPEDYKKIIIIGSTLKEIININYQDKIIFLDSLISKRKLWNYIQ